MKMPKVTLIYLVLGLGSSILLTACGPRGSAAVSEEHITNLAERKMVAINDGDYETFIEEFSEALVNAITEERFSDLRATILEASGRFDSISSSRIANARTQDYLNYIFNCKFEEEQVLLTLVYAIDGDKVEGIFFSGSKLNQAMRSG